MYLGLIASKYNEKFKHLIIKCFEKNEAKKLKMKKNVKTHTFCLNMHTEIRLTSAIIYFK